MDDAMAGFGLERWQAVAFFKSLDEIGCGRFVVGRKGHPSRFVWTHEPTSVAEAALGRRRDVAPLTEEEPAEDKDTAEDESDESVEEDSEAEEHVVMDDPEPPSPSAHIIDHSYALRPDFTVSLKLPVTLKKSEAERLAAFIRTLPFEQGD